MSKAYDAIVVGARCAGSSTAMLLARKGYRVLVVDRASFPSDTLSTHYIHQPGVAALHRWGLLDRVVASNCPPVDRQTLDLGPLVLRGSPPPVEGIGSAYCVRRTILDEILVRAAADAGAEVRQRFTVEELVSDGNRVTGIRGHDQDGAAVVEKAGIVIGADGLHSLVARRLGAPTYDEHPTLTCAYYSYWSGVELDHAELYPRPGRAIIAAPTNDGQIFTIVYWPASELRRVRSDVEGNFDDALDLVPQLAERVRAGTRSERFRGTGHLPNFFRRPHGNGWALVGDAGYHRDPLLALGISDAFRDAELLADVLDAGFSGRRALDAALKEYERRRNATARQGYENTIRFAALQPPPHDMQQLITALVHDQEQINRFFGVIIGTFPAAEFFAPENLGRIMSAVPAPVP